MFFVTALNFIYLRYSASLAWMVLSSLLRKDTILLFNNYEKAFSPNPMSRECDVISGRLTVTFRRYASRRAKSFVEFCLYQTVYLLFATPKKLVSILTFLQQEVLNLQAKVVC